LHARGSVIKFISEKQSSRI